MAVLSDLHSANRGANACTLKAIQADITQSSAWLTSFDSVLFEHTIIFIQNKIKSRNIGDYSFK